MIAVLMTELSGWAENRGQQTLISLITILTLIGSISMLRPDWCLAVFTGTFIWIGLSIGSSIWNNARTRDWFEKVRLPKTQVTLGKFGAVLCMGVAHIIVIMPVFILMNGLWGIPWTVLLEVIAQSLIALLIAAVLGRFTLHLNFEDKGLFSFLLAILWLAPTFLFPMLRPFNPLFQVWQITTTAQSLGIWWIGNLLLMIGLWCLENSFVWLEIKNND